MSTLKSLREIIWTYILRSLRTIVQYHLRRRPLVSLVRLDTSLYHHGACFFFFFLFFFFFFCLVVRMVGFSQSRRAAHCSLWAEECNRSQTKLQRCATKHPLKRNSGLISAKKTKVLFAENDLSVSAPIEKEYLNGIRLEALTIKIIASCASSISDKSHLLPIPRILT